MPQTADTNRRVVLSERPNGLPDAKTLQLEHGEVPTPGAGQVLLRTRYLSLDPYMRGRMNDAKSYAEPVKLGEVMTGQVVAEVLQSNCEGYALGDHVLAGSGWQDYALSDGTDLRNLGQSNSKIADLTSEINKLKAKDIVDQEKNNYNNLNQQKVGNIDVVFWSTRNPHHNCRYVRLLLIVKES